MRLIDADKLTVDMEERVYCGDGTYKIFGYSKKQIDSAPTINFGENIPTHEEERMEEIELKARKWEPQDLLDDLQEMIDEEPDSYGNERRAVLCMAREYLKEYFTTLPNPPLTLEELRGMGQRCEGVYVAYSDGTPVFREQTYCAAVLDFSPSFGSTKMQVYAIYGDRLTFWEDEYGKIWLAYRRKPEEGK